MTESLSDIRPGDKVVLRHSSRFTSEQVKTVDRVTKTQIIIGYHRFRISDGHQPGKRDLWSRYWIIPATPEKIAEVKRQQQLKQDRDVVRQLARQIDIANRDSSNAAAAIPHLDAALVALKQENN